MKTFLKILLFLFLFPQIVKADSIRVKRVVDGDTLELVGGTRVRLIGVDTPEVHDSNKLYRDSKRTKQDIKTIKKLGKRSSDFVKSILSKNKVIVLEYDQANALTGNKDKYGRTLAYVYVELPNGPPKDIDKDFLVLKTISCKEYLFLNATIIRAGYGNAYTSFPFGFSDEFRKYEKEARENNRGLWCEEKSAPDRDNSFKKEEYYVGSKNSEVFHRPSCNNALNIKERNIIKFKDRQEAIEKGRRPCKSCEP